MSTIQLPPALREEMLDRFLRYVQIPTEPDPTTTSTPSSSDQWTLLRMLQEELTELGVDVTLTEHGYVIATIPSNVSHPVPRIAFLAHVDTALDFTGKGVKPIVHERYDGAAFRYPHAANRVLAVDEFPALQHAIGQTIVTTSGDTLLGADDKAGVAIVMTFVEYVLAHPELPHGELRVCFNPDEEIGRGFDGLETSRLAADVAYTVDGDALGSLNYETFSADKARVTITGVSIHPGWAFGRLVNAIGLAEQLLQIIRTKCPAPEQSQGRRGYVHPVRIDGSAGKVVIDFILRDFDDIGLASYGTVLRQACDALKEQEPRADIECVVEEQYRNMRDYLAKDFRPVEVAREAMARIGVTPIESPIRGGTDGSHLTARGLPTPNLFTGGQNAHGPYEWVSVDEMEKSVLVCAQIVQIYAGQVVPGTKR